MLHGTLSRSYLSTSGINYLPGYLEEIHHPYAYFQHRIDESCQFIKLDDLPKSVEELRHAPSPSPLDLSLKSPLLSRLGTPLVRSHEYGAIEVDDEEDRRSRDEARSMLGHTANYAGRIEFVAGFANQESERLCLTREIELTGYCDSQQDVKSKYSPSYPQSFQSSRTTGPNTLKHQQQSHQPMTPPSTPSPPQCPKRKSREEEISLLGTARITCLEKSRNKKKHVRRLKFDEDTSSPVSGTVILSPEEAVVTGDIDPAFNIVEVTEEARAELAKIENRLGPYQCKLCRQLHDDAFQLAQHRCSRIAHVEYRCPECDKRFSCPANLASHRRWHKPRPSVSELDLACSRCNIKFARQSALRKHLSSHHQTEHNDNKSDNDNDNNNIDNNNERLDTTDSCKEYQQLELSSAGFEMA